MCAMFKRCSGVPCKSAVRAWSKIVTVFEVGSVLLIGAPRIVLTALDPYGVPARMAWTLHALLRLTVNQRDGFTSIRVKRLGHRFLGHESLAKSDTAMTIRQKQSTAITMACRY